MLNSNYFMGFVNFSTNQIRKPFDKKNTSKFTNKNTKLKINLSKNIKDLPEKQKIEAEKVFFEGPPSKTELIIPFISILTVLGIIPFLATLSRQFWVKYTITNRRISVDSGFQKSNHVEIVYKDIKKINYITRYGGLTADIVLVLKDNAQLEMRSMPNWQENYDYIKKICGLNLTDE
mmetsp:Transcript_41320/g.94133  ORF Transcript_41320/g.94133 Transcript_41320/m.94133 type:complete len:177 (-) Transcript_41320:4062-4592(-)